MPDNAVEKASEILRALTEKNASILSKQDQNENTENDDIKPEKQDIFRLVFLTAQKPDKQKNAMRWLLFVPLIILLVAQVAWAMYIIWLVITCNKIISDNSITFLTLVITAILGEVVAMVFFIVRFVFKSPIEDMLEILKELAKQDQSKAL